MHDFLRLLLLATFIISSSVNAEEVSYRELLKLNASNISKIKQGMNENQVQNIMGSYTSAVRNGPINNPWKTEHLGDTTIYHYLVRKNPPFVPLLENQADPVIIKNGKVKAVGRGFLKAARADANNKNFDDKPESLEQRLNTLKKLYEADAISKEDYQRQKQKILDSI